MNNLLRKPTLKDFQVLVATAFGAWPAFKPDEFTVEAWRIALADMPYQHILRAVSVLLKQPNQYPPTPGEVRAKIFVLRNARARRLEAEREKRLLEDHSTISKERLADVTQAYRPLLKAITDGVGEEAMKAAVLEANNAMLELNQKNLSESH